MREEENYYQDSEIRSRKKVSYTPSTFSEFVQAISTIAVALFFIFAGSLITIAMIRVILSFGQC